jgi:hypothetical protein
LIEGVCAELGKTIMGRHVNHRQVAEHYERSDGLDSLRVYRVATLEEQLEALSDTFRSLDLEGQQQVLATAAALRSSNAKCAHESQRGDGSQMQSSKRAPGEIQRISRLQNPSSKLK